MQRRLSPVRNANPVADAVRPIRYLREYSNYLTPRTGFLSADTWTMIGIFTRNALLNQVILVSLFAALLLMPRAIVKLVGAGIGPSAVWIDWLFIALIGGLIAVATWILIKNLRRLDPLGSEDRRDHTASMTMAVEPEVPLYARPVAIQLGVVLPWLLAMSVFILRFPDIITILSASQVQAAADRLGWPLLLATVVAGFSAIYVALLLGFGKAARCWEDDPVGLIRSFGSAILVGGAAAGAVSLALIHVFTIAGLDQGLARPWHAAVLGGPAAMLVISILIVVVLGMLGEKFPDEHREWWSRLRTFLHMYSVRVPGLVRVRALRAVGLALSPGVLAGESVERVERAAGVGGLHLRWRQGRWLRPGEEWRCASGVDRHRVGARHLICRTLRVRGRTHRRHRARARRGRPS